ncbi:MAG: 3-oxoacyl-ACP synthase [Bacteroidaceae bacterium]|nr:3-oxoacyl-ACP synthase [Bacteroidaceae bacterium]
MKIVATNITSPLGFTTRQNLEAVMHGQSHLHTWQGTFGIPEPFCASLFSDSQNHELQVPDMTRFQSLVYRSVSEALSHSNINVASSRTLLILSTTKGDITTPLSIAATKIAAKLGFTTKPIVVCNACTSGVCAQILALRLFQTGAYDNIVVCGADLQGKFIVSGFQSLKATSAHPCRPFDMERNGLNLGEAAATIIFSRGGAPEEKSWNLLSGDIRNDAHHISNPSKTAEGSYRSIQAVLTPERKDRLSLISVHGTATMYNDQMESVAIQRSGLSDVPVTALKGYYGHTMGATGVIETILAIHFADKGRIPPSRGFSELGVSGRINISDQTITTHPGSVLKIISGFGGCNAALYLERWQESEIRLKPCDYSTLSSVSITTDTVLRDGVSVSTTQHGRALLTEIYKTHIADYPKFYKMDLLSRLVFVASEMLIRSKTFHDGNECSVILFNRSSSIVADTEYTQTIQPGNYYPSPSVFVYTLPNICTGEIAIRNNYHGETSFYILPDKDHALMDLIVRASMTEKDNRHIITGWVDCNSDQDFEIELKLITRYI